MRPATKGNSDWLRPVSVLLWAVTFVLANGYGYAQKPSGTASAASQNQNDPTYKLWQIGGFAAGGFPPAYEVYSPESHYGVKLDLLNAGLQVGRMLTAPRGPGFLRGRGEAVAEVIPFWLAYYPKQERHIHFTNEPYQPGGSSPWGPYSLCGTSVTPLLFRWNFVQRASSRYVPWAQLGGGLLWTNHKFPLLGGSTSVINFTPQVDIGENVFIKKNRSLDFALKVVHISNASLGDHNPGLNLTLQFSAGYSWWK
jgi:hypothetical protein